MKKTLAILIGVATISAHAVSFNWTSAAQVTFNGVTLSTAGNTATAYLVYLGADGTWSFGTDISGTLANVTDSSVQNVQTRTSGSSSAKGKITPTSYTLNGNQGYSYGVLLKYTDSSDNIWYNLSSDTYTVGDVADNATNQSHDFAFSFANSGEVNALSAAQVGSGWYKVVPAVPEPSTAALALAGLALLLKRRKA